MEPEIRRGGCWRSATRSFTQVPRQLDDVAQCTDGLFVSPTCGGSRLCTLRFSRARRVVRVCMRDHGGPTCRRRREAHRHGADRSAQILAPTSIPQGHPPKPCAPAESSAVSASPPGALAGSFIGIACFDRRAPILRSKRDAGIACPPGPCEFEALVTIPSDLSRVDFHMSSVCDGGGSRSAEPALSFSVQRVRAAVPRCDLRKGYFRVDCGGSVTTRTLCRWVRCETILTLHRGSERGRVRNRRARSSSRTGSRVDLLHAVDDVTTKRSRLDRGFRRGHWHEPRAAREGPLL